MSQLPVVTIDGGAYTGTSTLAVDLARLTEGEYLNTGSVYRAFTWAFLRVFEKDVAGNEEAAVKLAREVWPEFEDGSIRFVAFDDGRRKLDVHGKLYTTEIDRNVAHIGAIPEIRQLVVDACRHHVQEMSSAGTCFFIEGRATGRRDFPSAPLKLWLTAELRVRVQRALYSQRSLPSLKSHYGDRVVDAAHRRELIEALEGDTVSAELDDVMQAIIKRDELDAQRAIDPMIPADDAVTIDTSNLKPHEVTAKAISLCRDRGLVA